MNAVISVFRELAGLFVDDGSLALAILAVIALAGIFSTLMFDIPLVAGAVLLFGCLGVLLANVARAAQR
jgi:hypothetical protein